MHGRALWLSSRVELDLRSFFDRKAAFHQQKKRKEEGEEEQQQV